MKEIVALLFGGCLTVITVYLAVRKNIDTKLTTVFLVFALGGGLGIANFDLIKSFKGMGVELETYERQVETIKTDALDEIETTVEGHKESIRLLMSSLNDTREQIDVQKRAVEALVGLIAEQETTLRILASDADSARQRIEVLHTASSDLSLLLVKITWLQTVTKGEFGTARSRKANEEILRELNRIIAIVLPDDQERLQWSQKLKQSLPP